MHSVPAYTYYGTSRPLRCKLRCEPRWATPCPHGHPHPCPCSAASHSTICGYQLEFALVSALHQPKPYLLPTLTFPFPSLVLFSASTVIRNGKSRPSTFFRIPSAEYRVSLSLVSPVSQVVGSLSLVDSTWCKVSVALLVVACYSNRLVPLGTSTKIMPKHPLLSRGICSQSALTSSLRLLSPAL